MRVASLDFQYWQLSNIQGVCSWTRVHGDLSLVCEIWFRGLGSTVEALGLKVSYFHQPPCKKGRGPRHQIFSAKECAPLPTKLFEPTTVYFCEKKRQHIIDVQRLSQEAGVVGVSKTCFTMATPQILDTLATKYPEVFKSLPQYYNTFFHIIRLYGNDNTLN